MRSTTRHLQFFFFFLLTSDEVFIPILPISSAHKLTMTIMTMTVTRDFMMCFFFVFIFLLENSNSFVPKVLTAVPATAPMMTKKKLAASSSNEDVVQTEEEMSSLAVQTETIVPSSSAPRQITWKAYKKSTVVVKEKLRSVEAYMALPSTEYSVLASDSIVRLDDRNFKAVLPTMNFFGTKITPILFVDVTVYPDDTKSVIAVQRAETVGSETALQINGTFGIEAINTVTAGIDDKGRKTLTSETHLKIDVVIPSSSKVPAGALRRTGNFLMQQSLNLIVPTFVRLLAFDFKRWSGGENSRSEIEGASLGAEFKD